jgi:hypothetical protein
MYARGQKRQAKERRRTLVHVCVIAGEKTAGGAAEREPFPPETVNIVEGRVT